MLDEIRENNLLHFSSLRLHETLLPPLLRAPRVPASRTDTVTCFAQDGPVHQDGTADKRYTRQRRRLGQ